MDFDQSLQTIQTGGNLPGAFVAAFWHAADHLLAHRNLDPMQRFASAVLKAPARPKGATVGRVRDCLDAALGAGTVVIKTEKRADACSVTLLKGANLPTHAMFAEAVRREWWIREEETEKEPKTDRERLFAALERFSKKHDEAALAQAIADFADIQRMIQELETKRAGK